MIHALAVAEKKNSKRKIKEKKGQENAKWKSPRHMDFPIASAFGPNSPTRPKIHVNSSSALLSGRSSSGCIYGISGMATKNGIGFGAILQHAGYLLWSNLLQII